MPGDWRRLAAIEMAPLAIGLASLATTPPPLGARLATKVGSPSRWVGSSRPRVWSWLRGEWCVEGR